MQRGLMKKNTNAIQSKGTDQQKQDPVSSIREQEQFLRRELNEPHHSYENEKLRHHIIRDGRTDLLDTVMTDIDDGTTGTLSKDRLRNEKNLLISAITLFTRYAMDGGLDEETAYTMSDSYIQYGELCKAVSEVDALYQRALREFTTAVHEKGKLRCSVKIRHSLRYIQVHLHDEITLGKIADSVKISPCYLSRLFQKEMDISIIEFIQKERVEAAKQRLLHTDELISVTSEYYHFSSQSYFIKIFKKYTGMTPAQYRKFH